jgi:hypothetical protein
MAVPDDVLQLEPVNVPEWDAEDLLAADLGDETSLASADEAREMFERITLTLPSTILHEELIGFAATRRTPLGEPIRVAGETSEFHLVELPLNILLPEDRRLVRLKLSIEAKPGTPAGSDAAGSSSDPVVAYDLFPPDTWEDKVHDLGEASLDVSAALRFVFPALPADALGLKLALPIRWRTRYVTVRTSDRLSNC